MTRCEFAHDDGAYVLGALAPADRAAPSDSGDFGGLDDPACSADARALRRRPTRRGACAARRALAPAAAPRLPAPSVARPYFRGSTAGHLARRTSGERGRV